MTLISRKRFCNYSWHFSVGSWSLTVATWYGERSMTENRDDLETFHASEPFYILFNPFNETDVVYMANPTSREEYVLADVGKVYAGMAIANAIFRHLFGSK